MSISMTPEAWESVVRKEYLQGFIKKGGAAVKFVVPSKSLIQEAVIKQVKMDAEADGYLCVEINGATTKAHMIDKVFHAIARQVAWDDLAHAFLRSCLSESHYRVPEDRTSFSLHQLAMLNELDLSEMRRAVNKLLRDRLFRDYEMAQEFRIAMLRICQAQLDQDEAGIGVVETVKEWLCGDLRLISALKPALIFQKVGRHNGRHMLFSLAHWLRICGKAGLMIILDISRFLVAKRPLDPDGGIYYSTSAVLDGYEVLRQLVDGTDEVQSCLTVVIAPPTFLIPEERRGLYAYDALKLRIWGEVHDRSRPNPLSPLVRLS